MNTVSRENGSKPCIAAMIGSVIAINSKGTRYACQPVRFAPANMQLHVHAATTRQDERTQRGPSRVHAVDFRLELLDFGAGHTRLARMRVGRLGGEDRAQIE